MKHNWIFAPVSYDDVTKTYDDEHKFMAFEKGKNGSWKEVSVWVDEHLDKKTGSEQILFHVQNGDGTYFNERMKAIIEKLMPSVECRCMQ
jgi:hypothetical protein